MQKSMRLVYEPASEPLRICVKTLFLVWASRCSMHSTTRRAAAGPARRATTFSTKVNLHHTIDSRAFGGANWVEVASQLVLGRFLMYPAWRGEPLPRSDPEEALLQSAESQVVQGSGSEQERGSKRAAARERERERARVGCCFLVYG